MLGLQLPATALADTAGVHRMGEVLAVLAQSGRPLLVHPGPVAPHPEGSPSWWPAVVPYVHQESVTVQASADDLYDLVCDITRTGEWSPVCTSCWWDKW